MKNVIILLFIVLVCSCATTGKPPDGVEVDTALKTRAPDIHTTIDTTKIHEPEILSRLLQAGAILRFGNTGIFAARTAGKIIVALAGERRKKAELAAANRIPAKPKETMPRETTRGEKKDTITPPKVVKNKTIPAPENTESNKLIQDAIPVSIDPKMNPAEVRTIYARKNDDIEVTFPENGWLLLSIPEKKGGLEYLSHSNNEKQTIFYFRGTSEGEYLLPFQLQDAIKGIFRNETIKIMVVPDDEFNAVMKQKQTGTTDAEDSARLEEAFELYEQNRPDAALDAFLKAYHDGDPRLNDTIALLYFNRKNYPRAEYYWRKNLQAPEPFRTNAIPGISKALRLARDTAGLKSFIDVVLRQNNDATEEELFALIRYFSDEGNDDVLLDLSRVWLDRYQYHPGTDEIYYRLARFFENNSTFRDYKKSRNFYSIVVQEYPASRYAMPSQERIDYLNRHYIKVR